MRETTALSPVLNVVSLFASRHVYMFFRFINFLCRLDGHLATTDRVIEA